MGRCMTASPAHSASAGCRATAVTDDTHAWNSRAPGRPAAPSHHRMQLWCSAMDPGLPQRNLMPQAPRTGNCCPVAGCCYQNRLLALCPADCARYGGGRSAEASIQPSPPLPSPRPRLTFSCYMCACVTLCSQNHPYRICAAAPRCERPPSPRPPTMSTFYLASACTGAVLIPGAMSHHKQFP